ncbi:putative ligase [Listeria phage vB_Liva_VAfA18]|uniref:Putative ligase n=1 Tax=Listeria phage vB_Liva_VAfA18 TaxID=2712945 RepID=A0A858EBP4_9CAUD|nr:RNA ligase [Listeria phage WIL-1]QIG60985.1 putative ligase [Listeria phage vB_Liva_VAfA18]
MNRYRKIQRIGRAQQMAKTYTGEIIILEKLDGSNASFFVEQLPDGGYDMRKFSRNIELDIPNEVGEVNTLSGFTTYIKDKVSIPDVVHSGLVNLTFFGEWLGSKKLNTPYKEQFRNNFYLFDVYSNEEGRYLPLDEVRSIAFTLNLPMPDMFYLGVFTDFDTVNEFVGQSRFTKETNEGEGIIVKFLDEVDIDGSQKLFKSVSPKHAERVQSRKREVKDLPESTEWIRQFVTETRVRKALQRLEEENKLPNLEFSNFSQLMKVVPSIVYDDIMSEESPDDLAFVYDEDTAKKSLGRSVPVHLREIILKVEDSK